MPSPLFLISKKLLARVPELSNCEDIETKIAIALLLSHLIPADGKVLDCEIDRLTKLAARRFQIEPSIVRKFMTMTQFNRKNPLPVEILANRLKETLDEKHLKAFIRDLWDIAMIDNELHALEEAMIYHVADKLNIRRRDVIEMQSKVSNMAS